MVNTQDHDSNKMYQHHIRFDGFAISIGKEHFALNYVIS